MKIGYIVASNEVMVDGKPVGYLYREAPRDDLDSGWRVFSGDENEEYLEDASKFSMYNATTVLECSPQIKILLGFEYPIEFEFDQKAGEFIKIED